MQNLIEVGLARPSDGSCKFMWIVERFIPFVDYNWLTLGCNPNESTCWHEESVADEWESGR